MVACAVNCATSVFCTQNAAAPLAQNPQIPPAQPNVQPSAQTPQVAPQQAIVETSATAEDISQVVVPPQNDDILNEGAQNEGVQENSKSIDGAAAEVTNSQQSAETASSGLEDIQIVSIENFFATHNAVINKFNLNENVAEFILIDVRETNEFFEERIPGAINIPLSVLRDSYVPEFNKKMIVYCRSGVRSKEACKILSERFPQKKDIFSLEGGISAWKANNYFVEAKSGVKGFSLPRQTQVIAGGTIALFSLFACSATSLAFIPFVLGCGFVYAGLANSCKMAEWLKEAPWNK